MDLESGDVLWETRILPSSKSFVAGTDIGYAFTRYGELYSVDLRTGEPHQVLSLEPAAIVAYLQQHLALQNNVLLMTPGNSQIFAFQVQGAGE